MRKKPVHRQHRTPWYDTDIACRASFWFLALVLIFGLAGILVALDTEPWLHNIWVPLVLCLVSFWLMVRIRFRVKRRQLDSGNPETGGIP